MAFSQIWEGNQILAAGQLCYINNLPAQGSVRITVADSPTAKLVGTCKGVITKAIVPSGVYTLNNSRTLAIAYEATVSCSKLYGELVFKIENNQLSYTISENLQGKVFIEKSIEGFIAITKIECDIPLYTLTKTLTNSSVTVYKNGSVYTGTSIQHGDTLSFTAAANSGHTIQTYTTTNNGSTSNWSNGQTLTVAGNVTVTVASVGITYTLTKTLSNATITVYKNGSVYTGASIQYGDTLSFTAAANSGYVIQNYTVTNGGSTSNYNNGQTLTVNGNVTVNVVSASLYTLTINSDSNTQIQVQKGVYFPHDCDGGCYCYCDDGSQIQDEGPNTAMCYERAEIVSNGSALDAGNTLLITASSKNAGYEIQTYTVTNNGSTSNWSNSQIVTINGDITVTVASAPRTYTLTKTLTNSSVTVYKNGSLYTGTSIQHGDTLSFTAAANSGYTIQTYTVTHNGSTSNWSNGQTLTVAGSVTVRAISVANTYTLTKTLTNSSVTVYKNGSVYTGTSIQTGDILSFTATANSGYTIQTYTTTNNGSTANCSNGQTLTVAGNVTVTVASVGITYTLTKTLSNATVTVYKNGSVYTGTSIQYGDTVSFTAAANSGYAIQTYTVTNGSSISNYLNGQTLTVSGNVTVNVVAVKLYALTINSDSNIQIQVQKGVYPAYDCDGGCYCYCDGGLQIQDDGFNMCYEKAETVSGGSSLKAGDTLLITASTNSGYEIQTYTVTNNGSTSNWSNDQVVTVSGDIVVTAMSAPRTYTLTKTLTNSSATVYKNGSVFTGTSIQYGDTLSFTVTANNGYTIQTYKVTHNGSTSNWSNGQTLTVSGNVTINVTTTAIVYTLTKTLTNSSVTVYKNGSVYTGTSIQTGDTLSFTAAANSGYTIQTYTTTNNGSTANCSNGQTLTVAGNVIVTVASVGITYTLTKTLSNATVTVYKSGSVYTGTSIQYGDTLSFTATANSGYAIQTYTITNGGSTSSYSNGQALTVSGNVTVNIVAVKLYTLTINSDSNIQIQVQKGVYPAYDCDGGCYCYCDGGLQIQDDGFNMCYEKAETVSGGSSLKAGDTLLITASTNSGYEIQTYTVTNNGSTSNWSNGQVVTVSGDVVVNLTSTPKTYTLTKTLTNSAVTVYKNGSVYSGTSIQHGDTLSFTAAANSGYTIQTYTVTHNGSTPNWSNGQTLTVVGSVTIRVSSTANTYSLTKTLTNSTVTIYKNGSVYTGTSIQTGDILSFTAAANSGYTIQTYTTTNNGSTSSWSNGQTLTVAGNVTVTVASVGITYTLTKTLSNATITIYKNGSIYTGTAIQTGDTLSFTAIANSGYAIQTYMVTNGSSTSNWSNGQTLSVSGNVTVNVVSVKLYTLTINSDSNIQLQVQKGVYPAYDCDGGCYCYCDGGLQIQDDGFNMCYEKAETVYNGSTLKVGDTLLITASANSGYAIQMYTVTNNGSTSNWSNGQIVTVNGDIVVTATTTAVTAWKTITSTAFSMSGSGTGSITKSLSGLVPGRPTRITVSGSCYYQGSIYHAGTGGSGVYYSTDCDGGCYCYCNDGTQLTDCGGISCDPCYDGGGSAPWTETFYRYINTGVHTNSSNSTITLSLGTGTSVVDGTVSVPSNNTLSFNGYNASGNDKYKYIYITKVEQNY